MVLGNVPMFDHDLDITTNSRDCTICNNYYHQPWCKTSGVDSKVTLVSIQVLHNAFFRES